MRAIKRKAYQFNIEENRAVKRKKYENNKDNIREKKRKLYTVHRKRELNRLRKFYIRCPKNKKVCNKKYYENHKKYIRIRQKKNLTNKICGKYKQMYIKANKIGLLQSMEVYIKVLLKNINGTEMAEKRIQAEQTIKWCLHARDNYITVLKKTLSLLKKKAIVSLAQITEYFKDINFDNYSEALCGLCKHTSSTESFFYETSYKYVKFNEPLIMNENGHVINVLPIIEKHKKIKTWKCGFFCKGNDICIINRFKQFLTMIQNCSVLRNLPRFIKSIGTCTLRHSDKLGHSQACYIDHKLCKSKILALYFLSPHYPRVRNIRRLTYRLKHYYEKLIKLDEALLFGNIQTLRQVMETTRNKCTFTDINDKGLSINEDEIMSKYSQAFTLLTKRSMDVPQFPCLSCEKLCFRRNVIDITKFRKPLSRKQWNKLMNYLNINIKSTFYICRYCLTYFRNDTLPPTCILNNLHVDKVPNIIITLNEYEKILIQRAKAFQTIQKMGTVSKKNLPHSHLQKKVKGRTFHLPLPMEETIKKICAPTDVINCNHELYILVRGIPTKSKVIWENLVNVKKVYEVLTWLKKHNPLYAKIRLPDSHNNLLSEELNETEYQLNNNAQHTALLTQIIDPESYYEQFTIYPMYVKRINESPITLYQMLKVQDMPIDNRHKSLDLLCFPDLYPFGKNGQHENRTIRLPDNEFIKSRLLSKHSQFRLNIQYIFYLLNDTNIRQLNSGIYHEMNMTNPREKFTAKRFLEAMSKKELEGNINTIFSRLRNTAQYWRKPRCDLSCMIHHYGPATWFLTLSPSEWLWSHMIEYLREVNPEMSKKSANELIASDPISVSRYIENKFHAILEFLCSSDHPIGEITHYFWRREYQGRGTQHFHLLIWIKDAPIIGESSNEEIAKFLLEYVTCKLPDKNISPVLYRRVNTHQCHIHNNYCLRIKKTKNGITRVCRFGFPRPITNTLILKDLISSIAGRKSLKAKSRLYDLPRKENEKNINDYNPTILTAWEGNMDIQFIGEKSTLLNWYCTKYTTKYETSDANNTFEEINSTKSLRSRLWNFAMRNLNNRECGALEACDTLLGISLYGTDPHTTIRWLNINEVRCRKIKPRKEIEFLNADSTDIFCKSIIDNYYPARPQELESLNLYNFAKWYDVTKKKPINNFYVLQDSSTYPCYIKKRQREYLINHYRYNVEMQPEKYFYSLLLLFKPWRNLSELKEEYPTYAEAFVSIQSQLPEAMHYHEKITNNQKYLKDIKEAIERNINQVSEEHNEQCNEETEFIAYEAGNAMHEFRDVLGKTKNVNINELISGLNNDQRRVFDTVVNTINSNSKCLRHYVSGEGGTGKSYLIKTIKYWIQETIKKDVAIIAPTGIAAFNIDGLTIHRFFQLPVEHGYTPKYKQLSDVVLKTLRDELKNTTLIIIDEISMVSNITFMYIHLRLTEIFNTFDDNDGWFGKKHILLFGDLLQLPPVHEESAFMKISKAKAEKYLGSLGIVNLWADLFTYDELRINMRQRDDSNYRELLSRIRLGIVTDIDIKTLNSRKINFTSTLCNDKLNELCDYITKLPSDTVCLLPTCYLCNVLNIAMLERIPSENISLLAQDIIDCPKYLAKKVQKAINTDDEDSTKTAGLSKEIIIKIGAKIMLRRNIDVTLGLVNGTIATVTKISRDIDNKDVNMLTITLPNGKEHNIERVNVKFEIMDKAYVIRKQFPLSLSYGITIHKSQGLSLKSAVIDVGNLIFSSGQTYVALSRLTSIEGLHLINYDPASVKVNEFAVVEYNRLRSLYRQDIENIDINKNCHYNKISDETWAIPTFINQDIYTDSEFINNTLSSIKGFTNIDNVSCYANATLQCLIHNNVIRKLLLKHNEITNAINILINDYIGNKNILSCITIRQFIGDPFTLNIQQDAAEFLIALCTKITILKDTIEHDLSTTIHCTKCNYTSTKTQKNYIISLTIPPFCKQSIDLEYIIKYNFSRWSSLNGTCENCQEKNSLIIKNGITSAKQVIILQLALFSCSDKGISKITKCNIKGVPTVKLSIATNLYNVSSAIFHHGNDLHEGHFTNMLRDYKTKKSKWIYVNDNIITHKPWPRGSKDAYIFFLELCK